ncbi:MAG: GFA family protein [Gammaproteobacteria bacterium]
MDRQHCACGCGHVTFDVTTAPLFRFFCHCTICQRFNGAPYADVVVYAADSVTPAAPGTVAFATYRPPPNVQRGKCARCGAPAMERLALPLMPKLTMVPAPMHATAARLPEPRAHVFYETRLADSDDELPKHRGYLASQLAFTRWLLAAKLGRR